MISAPTREAKQSMELSLICFRDGQSTVVGQKRRLESKVSLQTDLGIDQEDLFDSRSRLAYRVLVEHTKRSYGTKAFDEAAPQHRYGQ